MLHTALLVFAMPTLTQGTTKLTQQSHSPSRMLILWFNTIFKVIIQNGQHDNSTSFFLHIVLCDMLSYSL